jgi:hypothetical protein
MKLRQDRSHNNTKLLQGRSHNMKLRQDRSHNNTKLLQGRSHNMKLRQDRSHNMKLRQDRSHNMKRHQDRSHNNTKLLQGRSHNMKRHRKRRANLRRDRSPKKGSNTDRFSQVRFCDRTCKSWDSAPRFPRRAPVNRLQTPIHMHRISSSLQERNGAVGLS